MDATAVAADVERAWERDVLPALNDYIAIPNVSPLYEPDWAEKGHMAAAVDLVRRWCEAQPIDGMTVEVRELPGRTPLLLCDIPATDGVSGTDDPVLLYGHLDKQPPMDGWADGLGPWTPVRRDDRLYGRGGADDGYAAFAALRAIAALREAGGRHARCVLVVEASEESGSIDLEAHVDALGDRLGTPSLVVCLDSTALDADHLWVTTSLRGLIGIVLTVEILEEGVHSGSAGGVVPSSFRIVRVLLDRIEDPVTGELLVPELHGTVPDAVVEQLRATAAEVGAAAMGEFRFVAGSRPVHDGHHAAQLLARWWEPALAYTGIGGAPPIATAGNVLRASTSLKLSFRLPPQVDPKAAADAVQRTLTADPPYGARVRAELVDIGAGWSAPEMAPWLRAALDEASTTVFGQPARVMGEGGSIPFMAMLGKRFPDAQFVVTGALEPGTNAHGPNEYLPIGIAKGITRAIAHVLDAHARR